MTIQKPREIGDQHVMEVARILREYLRDDIMPENLSLAGATALFIIENQQNILSVKSKFEAENSNTHPDLILTLHNGDNIVVNLYKIKNNQRIQPKNLGAKSFLARYFNSQNLQDEFNDYFEIVYLDFLNEILNTSDFYIDEDSSIEECKKEIRRLKPCITNFTEELNEFRSRLLYELREKCFSLFLNEYNTKSAGIESAFNELFMTDSMNIISRHKDDALVRIEEFKVDVGEIQNIKLSKMGSNTLGITSGNTSLLLRFKFESGPLSSIKLATSFAENKTEAEVVSENDTSLKAFQRALSKRLQINVSTTDKNAIGKCSESIFYCQLLEQNPDAKQLDSEGFVDMFAKYSLEIPEQDITAILTSTVDAVLNLLTFLNTKHGQYIVESIELVPDKYLKNRLDTADIELVLKAGEKYITEPVSLKATRTNTGSVVCKNPGGGQILGPTYFNLNQKIISDRIEELKANFINTEEGRRDVMSRISKDIGEQLAHATDEQLSRGVQALLGRAIVVIVFYRQNKHALLEHDKYISNISFHPNVPTNIQNELSWFDGIEKVQLRVKFSSGIGSGWSSIKLACTHKFSINDLK